MKITRNCMDAIMASRMIRSDSQREHIRAAISNPINSELVKQLVSYLDDDAKETLKAAEKEISDEIEAKKAEKEADAQVNTMDTTADMVAPSGRTMPSGRPSRSTPMMDMETPDLPGDFAQDDEEEAPDVESSEKVKGTKITASAAVRLSKLIDTTGELKGLLNEKDSTAGVQRAAVKEDEVWIYYNDSVNLNTVMGDVIETLSNPYPWLAFNRLARTDNAMVFVLDTVNQYNNADPEADAE